MDTIVRYLTDPKPGFGILAAIFLIVQVAILGAGVYLVFLRKDVHVLRGPALRRLGVALLVIGIVGIIIGGLRLASVVPFAARYWFYLVAVLELALAIYAEVYRRTTYRTKAVELARSKGVRRSSPVAAKSALSTNVTNNSTNSQPVALRQARPSATSSRRDSRRDRKRRKR